jgi:hypothetical protein
MAEIFSGRIITDDDMEIIRWTRDTYPNLSRYELAGTVCEFIGWVTPSGGAKVPQCIDFFARMEAEGKLDLPALKARKPSIQKEKTSDAAKNNAHMPEVTECGGIELLKARPGADMQEWRRYVNEYHMLGDKNVFGSRIYYFIRSERQTLGCMLFSAASWALENRDRWIGWSAGERKERLYLIVNNTRFLILPNVRVKNLASRALSLAAKQLPSDWVREFGYSPVLLETFVDTSIFAGTSYTAANWILLGHTKGRGRMDRHHKARLSQKAIFVYPLRPDFADILRGDKELRVGTHH